MPSKTVVLCTVAMTQELLERTPRLKSFGTAVPIGGMTPAVTAAVQSTYLTGLPPSGHGAVGNGWLFRDTMEVRLWQQSNRLVQAPKVWESAEVELREPVLVVRDVLVGGRDGDAAADVSRRRPQDPRLLHQAR